MKVGRLTNRHFLWIILLFGFLLSVLNLNYNSVFHDEAFHILLGRQVLSGENCPGCAYATGSVLIHPVVAAIGDYLGGLYGARAMNILFCLALTIIIYETAHLLFDGRYGLISAFLFLFASQTLYLSKLATYDMIAAFFLGLSFYLILLSEKTPSTSYKNVWLLCGAVSLFLSAITKYLVPVFIPPLVIYVFFKQKFSRALFFFLLPLSVFLLLYAYFALYPDREALMGTIGASREATQIPFSTLYNWTFRWVAMAYLLSFFGVFHEKKGKIAILLIILSTPIIIMHLATGAEQSVNKNVILSFIFLSLSSALGVDHIGNLFSMKSTSQSVKTF